MVLKRTEEIRSSEKNYFLMAEVLEGGVPWPWCEVSRLGDELDDLYSEGEIGPLSSRIEPELI